MFIGTLAKLLISPLTHIRTAVPKDIKFIDWMITLHRTYECNHNPSQEGGKLLLKFAFSLFQLFLTKTRKPLNQKPSDCLSQRAFADPMSPRR